ncbi:MAG: response regulator [Planctomycetota bacterium]
MSTIVVVDDEADVSRYLAAALEDEGYTVRVASNAEDGLALIREVGPALVCLDLVMPGRTGMSLYRELKEIPELADLPAIVVTGVTRADAESRLGLGRDVRAPDGYIEKPVDIPQFLETVGRLAAPGRRQP